MELSQVCADDADLRHLHVPVGGQGLEDETELAVVSGFKGGGADGLGIDVGLVGADECEGQGLDLGGHLLIVAEEHLDGDGSCGLGSCVLDVAVDEGGFSS
jgi:hypothetical protein